MIKKIINDKTKCKILKPYLMVNPEDNIPVKDIYVCRVVSNFPQPEKITSVMENGLFVKKSSTIYIHIASGKEIATIDSVGNLPTMFAVDNIRLFSVVFTDYIKENNLNLDSTLSVDEISSIENNKNATSEI